MSLAEREDALRSEILHLRSKVGMMSEARAPGYCPPPSLAPPSPLLCGRSAAAAPQGLCLGCARLSCDECSTAGPQVGHRYARQYNPHQSADERGALYKETSQMARGAIARSATSQCSHYREP